MSIEPDRFFSPAKDGNDARFDRALRPQALADYIGQQAVKEQMQIFIEAARQRKHPDRAVFFDADKLVADAKARFKLPKNQRDARSWDAVARDLLAREDGLEARPRRRRRGLERPVPRVLLARAPGRLPGGLPAPVAGAGAARRVGGEAEGPRRREAAGRHAPARCSACGPRGYPVIC